MGKIINRFELAGFLFRDPELKSSKGGNPFCTFTIKQGKKGSKESTFWNCVAFKENASLLGGLRDRDWVHVEGNIERETWEKDGVKREKYKVLVSSVLGSEGKGESLTANESDFRPIVDDSDIPF